MFAADRPTHFVPHDSTIVCINEPAELAYWAGRFRATSEDVIQAVGLVGPKFRDVELHLEHVLVQRARSANLADT